MYLKVIYVLPKYNTLVEPTINEKMVQNMIDVTYKQVWNKFCQDVKNLLLIVLQETYRFFTNWYFIGNESLAIIP